MYNQKASQGSWDAADIDQIFMFRIYSSIKEFNNKRKLIDISKLEEK
jgi:hypothetical protein